MLSTGRLKPFVNDPILYAAFLEYMTFQLDRVHKTMEQTDNPDEWMRSQGEARLARRLMQLRDIVNGDKRNG